MKKLINNIFGEKFEYEVVEKEYVDVLAAGYIITPEGEFIEVKDDNSHGDVFSKYLAKYLKESVVKYYETIKATGKLISLNHIVYLGIKTIDMKEIYKNSGQNNGYGILIIPG